MYTLFVIDYDRIYSNEKEASIGVAPSVYLILQEQKKEVERYAKMAFDEFLDESSDKPVGDIFEEWMDNNGIYYQYIGDIEIAFGERQTDYLAEYIPRN